jgi:hypothetical protein
MTGAERSRKGEEPERYPEPQSRNVFAAPEAFHNLVKTPSLTFETVLSRARLRPC